MHCLPRLRWESLWEAGQRYRERKAAARQNAGGSAMGAAAVTEMLGGTPEMAFHAAAMALKNVLGLTCDPVAGLVEIPCIKRNASGAMNALLSADLAFGRGEKLYSL